MRQTVHLKRFLPFLLAFVLPLLLVYTWWGGFNPVELSTRVRGPYTYAYLEHIGDYAKLPEKLGEVARVLEASEIRPASAITILYSHPDVVSRSDRKARAGYLIPPGTRPPAPLQTDHIPARSVLTASVQASVLIAPSRAYQALDDYLQARGQGIRMPTVEIYEDSASVFRMGTLTVEVTQP